MHPPFGSIASRRRAGVEEIDNPGRSDESDAGELEHAVAYVGDRGRHGAADAPAVGLAEWADHDGPPSLVASSS
jgi:hypothetical protein